MTKTLLCSLFYLFITHNSYSNEGVWRVNGDHSELFFKIPYLSISNVSGRFTSYNGRISFDEDNPNLPTNIRIKIQSSSIFTGSKIRDGHLKSKDFFYKEKYPNILFESHKISPKSVNEFDVWGNLTIKDFKKEVKVTMKMTDIKKDSWDYLNRFVTFQTKIDRRDFGLTWNKSLKDNKYLVGDQVKIWGNFQVQPLNQITPDHKYMIPNTKYTKLKNKLLRGDISVKEFKSKVSLAPQKIIAKSESIKDQKEPANTPTVLNKASQTLGPGDKPSTAWWIAYTIIGFIGFLATIMIALQGKHTFLKLWPNKYQENNILGISSDLFAYGIAFIYAWAMWVLVYN